MEVKYRTIIVIDHTSGEGQEGFTANEYCTLTDDQINNGEFLIEDLIEDSDSWTVCTTPLGKGKP